MKAAAVKALMNNDLENFIVASSPGGIEAQEARGQDRLVHSDLLPREINGRLHEGLIDMPTVCERIGIKILGDADNLFYNVELPVGWTKQVTGHSMWSKVVDERGRERMSVFYKAAFYDRRSFVNIETRYKATYGPVGGWNAYSEVPREPRELKDAYPFVAQALDGDVVIWQSEPIPNSQQETTAFYDMARAWLTEHYPDWCNEFAYWDEE